MAKGKSKRKMINRESPIEGAISDAMSEIQSLRDEMCEWRDNMSGNNMEHLPKYEEVETAHDELDQVADNEPSVPSKLPAGLEDKVKWTEVHTYARSQSRATRASDCSAALTAVVDHIEAFLEKHGADHEVWKDMPDDAGHSEWEQLVDDVREIADAVDGVSFPGMYG